MNNDFVGRAAETPRIPAGYNGLIAAIVPDPKWETEVLISSENNGSRYVDIRNPGLGVRVTATYRFSGQISDLAIGSMLIDLLNDRPDVLGSRILPYLSETKCFTFPAWI